MPPIKVFFKSQQCPYCNHQFTYYKESIRWSNEMNIHYIMCNSCSRGIPLIDASEGFY